MSNPGVSEQYIQKANRILDVANKRQIPLRVMGCIAVKMHSKQLSEFHENVMKRYATDIDFMTISKYRGDVIKILTELGYSEMRTMTPREDRLIYLDKEEMHVDVFFDKLSMCHVIDFRNRLQVDSPTISLSDIMLEKLQIVKINEKDIKDVIIMLREHEIANRETEAVNSEYISKLLANDWGFYYTATTNLKLIRDRLDNSEYKKILKPEDIADVKAKIDRLLELIEQEPKSSSWKSRSKTGTKKKWYQDVEEVQVGSGEFENELAKLLKG